MGVPRVSNARMIQFDQVTKKFGEITALDQVSLKMKGGEFIFVIGPSGAGKTTLINLILKKYPPTSGTIIVGDIDISKIKGKKIPEYRKKIGVVFQDFKLISDLNVFENVALALRILGKKDEEISLAVNEVLRLVGLQERASLFPSQLAGGELQRACIARALVAQPEIVLADEPTGNLDLETAKNIVGLLKKINEMGKTVLMATHNFEIVNELNQRVIRLEKGKIVSDQPKGKYQFEKNETTFTNCS